MEQILEYTEGLQLRAEHLLPVNTPRLETLKNLRCFQGSLRQFNTITQPFTNSYITSTLLESKAWPYPQIFLGKRVSLLCFEQSIYTLTETSGNWTASPMVLKDAATFESGSPISVSLSAGYGPWQFLDFHDSWMLFNGKAVVFKSPLSSNVFATESVEIQHGGVWRDTRAVLAGFSASNFFALSAWKTYLQTLDDNVTANLATLIAATTQGPGQNWVWVTSTGGEECWFPFSLNWVKYGSLSSSGNGYSDTKPFIFDLLGRNEASFLPMPWQGKAVAGKALGDGYVVYGQQDTSTYKAGGITGLWTNSGQICLRDISGLLPGIGVAGRGAVGGDETGHLFVDENSTLRSISPDFQVGELGYQDKLNDLVAADIVISYDAAKREYYITDGVTSYLYNESGMCEAPNCPTSLHIARGGLVGVYFPVSDPTALTLLSHPFQQRKPGTSVVEYVEAQGIDTSTGITVSLDYRLRNKDGWTTTASVVADKNGRAYFFQSGVQFRWRITHTAAANCVIDGVYVKFDSSAKRKSADWYAASTPSGATLP